MSFVTSAAVFLRRKEEYLLVYGSLLPPGLLVSQDMRIKSDMERALDPESGKLRSPFCLPAMVRMPIERIRLLCAYITVYSIR